MRRAAVVVGVAAAALLLLLLAVDGTRRVEVRVTDPILIVRGSGTVVDCIERGDLVDCAPVAGGHVVGAWPLVQYLFAVPLAAAGVGEHASLVTMAAVSSLAALGMLALVAGPARRLLGTAWAVVLGLILLTGPFLLYGLLPFGEALAAFLALAFVLAACARSPAWVFVLAVAAGITKETAAPFLVVLGLVCARSAADRWLPPRRMVGAMVGGAVAAVALNSLFNVFRFGTPRNLTYTEPSTRVPGLARRAELALADWFAPNVGVVWFWFLAALVVAGVVVATVVLLLRDPRDLRAWMPPAVVVGLVALFTAGLASWYSTFGWVAWGPRLTLNLVPAFVVAGIWTARAPMTAGLHWICRHVPALAAVGAVTAVLALAQIGVVWNPAAIELPLVTDAACPQILELEDTTADVFYGCGLHAAWRLDPLSLWEAAGGGPTTQRVAQGLVVVVVLCAACWLRADARRRDDGAVDRPPSLVAG